MRLQVAASASYDKTCPTLPTWGKFEMGMCPVYWEHAADGMLIAGEPMTVWYNPEFTLLAGPVGFTGTFNDKKVVRAALRIDNKQLIPVGPNNDAHCPHLVGN
jgi:hypothetical protein